MTAPKLTEARGVLARLAFDRSALMAMSVADALVRGIIEHGAPNTFGFAELVGHRSAMFAGKAVRKHWPEFCLNVHARLPSEFDHVRINLSGGRLHVVDAGRAALEER